MAYNPDETNLPREDWEFLESIHQMFLNARLSQGARAVVQGHVIGKMLAEAESRSLPWHSIAAAHLPVTVDGARGPWRFTPADEKAIDYSLHHAAVYVTDMADRVKEDIRADVTGALAMKMPPQELARALFDRYGELNRDWRRIALTETATAVTNGYLATLAPEEMVVGDSSADACPWCLHHIHMHAFRVLPEAPDTVTEELSAAAVWPGKTNVGRSRYSRRADGSVRPPEEMWHPCIPAHPHCRCRWRRLIASAERIVAGTNRVEDILLTPQYLGS